jgi:putative flippase GtrA
MFPSEGEHGAKMGLLASYLIQKSDQLSVQFLRYLFVGGAAAAVDTGVFYAAHNITGYHYLGAQTMGFLSGVITNYILSILWVFRSSGSVRKEFTLFVLIGVGGLLMSYASLWLLIDVAELRYFKDMLAKAVTILVGLSWNFLMRRRFVFNYR